MPRAHPPGFRQRAVELARLREKPVAQIATDLGIPDSCLRGWMAQADRDEGRRSDGVTTTERDELLKLRRELRVPNLEVEILEAAAYCRPNSAITDPSARARLTLTQLQFTTKPTPVRYPGTLCSRTCPATLCAAVGETDADVGRAQRF